MGRGLAEKVKSERARISELERHFYRRHIKRLEEGLSESVETSSIHLDVLANLKRINTNITGLVTSLLGGQID